MSSTQTGPRGEITTSSSNKPRFGSTRRWSRTIGGARYSFTAVLMPNGERRYAVSKYNGYGDDGTEEGRAIGMRFGCAWTEVHFITVPAPATDHVAVAQSIREIGPGATAAAITLESYLRDLPVKELRRMAADGMRYRHKSRKAEIVAWLVRYLPDTVREHRFARQQEAYRRAPKRFVTEDIPTPRA